MNRIADSNMRLMYGNEAVGFMNQQLKEGYNPFEQIKFKKLQLPVIAEQLKIIVREATIKATDALLVMFDFISVYTR